MVGDSMLMMLIIVFLFIWCGFWVRILVMFNFFDVLNKLKIDFLRVYIFVKFYIMYICVLMDIYMVILKK